MNQVTELLRLVPGASLEDATIRLSTLIDLMSRAHGFRSAEVLRKTDEPDLLMVLHTWDHMDDWHDFRCSDTKMAFAAARPDFLYQFVPCGINWLLQEGEATLDGNFVRRELVRGALQPVAGEGVITSQIFSYQDYDPAWQGVTLRLTRHRSAPDAAAPAEGDVLSDEVFESVKKHDVVSEQAKVAG